MKPTQDKNINRFLSLFHAFEDSLNGEREHPFHEWRRTAIDRLRNLRFPTRKDEEWKYTPVTRVVTPSYSLEPRDTVDPEWIRQAKIADWEAPTLTFVNGQLKREFSDLDSLPDGLELFPMQEAFQNPDFKEVITELFEYSTEKTQDPFLVMNAAFSRESYFFYVPKNVALDKPVRFLYINTQQEQPFFYNPQKLVLIESGAKMELVESFVSVGEGGNTAEYFSNIHNAIHLRGNAQMQHYKFQRESNSAYHLNNTSIYQDRDSHYSHYQFDLGGQWVRNNLNAYHKGENITTDFYGAFLGKGRQHIDSHTLIDHAIPHCQSNELYKGILDDRARGVFNGKVVVHKDAQKTNAFQQNSSLLLSDKAVMDAKPQLEIFADDVKCSHGATIGQLDETSVFYLRSRGISKTRAREILQAAFILEVVELIPDDALRAHATEMIEQKLMEQ